jgi:hypothetical protein
VLAVMPGPPRAPAAEPLVVACSAERPSVGFGEATGVNAWAMPASGARATYAWDVTAGRVDRAAARARWDLADVRPGTYVATVRVTAGGAEGDCVVRVVVRPDAAGRDLTKAPARETGFSVLLPDETEVAGYGLYTYLLFGAPPSAAARDRLLRTLSAFTEVVPDIASLARYVPRGELNVAYIPQRTAPGRTLAVEALLEAYDYARARSLLRRLPGNTRDGPYLLSVLQPLGPGSTGGAYLFQDLSRVPPHLVEPWVKEFLTQAAQERFWEPRTGERLALRLRVTVGVLGAGLPEVRKALDTWISWVH